MKTSKPASLSTAPKQLGLKLEIAAEREIDGVGMGVLNNGAPFLTLRGLARMCGVDHAQIIRITSAWQEYPARPREQKIKELIRAAGADDSIAFIAIPRAGTIYHAVPDAVCMAVLEYYAFEAKGDYGHAAKSFRTLARKGFQEFIYSQVGWNPSGSADIAWQQFHDRVSLVYHTVPMGYFSVFKEIADLMVTLLRQGASLGNKFIPDISVGIAWAKYWNSENLEVLYGNRIKYEHNYPNYFPQSASNPQSPYCYPDEALGEFRKWIREAYIPNQMPIYLGNKVKDKELPASAVQAALEAFAPNLLNGKNGLK
ncbi:hypothetical protein [Belnapia moabensis]|uniref:hypothetical protein n=1 Tax=Belnapia moabensis TaxID=365533 RepID=UPI0009FD71F6|nr:hypothetical protein [Belnapia moabensis]